MATIRALVTYGNNDFDPDDDWKSRSNPWTVELRYRRRRLTVPFWTGVAITSEPTAADVLGCLLSDASSYKSARDLEDWASDLGYDTDSRKAEKTYRAVEKLTRKLRKFLGDDFESFLRLNEDQLAKHCSPNVED